VRIYQKASTKSKSIKVKKGTKVTVKSYSTKTGWAKITRSGKTGYVQLKYVNRVKPVKAYAAKNATIYKTAGTSQKLQTVSKGDVFYVLGASGSYTRIPNKSGSKVGYIKTSCITYSKPKTTSSSSCVLIIFTTSGIIFYDYTTAAVAIATGFSQLEQD